MDYGWRKSWVARRVDRYRFQRTTPLHAPSPVEVDKELGCQFARMPFPQQNYALWMFQTEIDRARFDELVDALYPACEGDPALTEDVEVIVDE